jgi:dihydrofolate reductase
MRKLTVLMQTTLDGRISHLDGSFWQPFAWGEEETAYVNEAFARADTWVGSRRLYEAVVPYWEQVAAGTSPDTDVQESPASLAFARLLVAMRKVVLSRTLVDDPSTRREIKSGDAVEHLRTLKEQDGDDIIASFGPSTLGPLADAPGLIDQYLLVIHPAVLTSGPRLFEHLTRDLALSLTSARVFDSGAAVMHYRTRETTAAPTTPPSGPDTPEATRQGATAPPSRSLDTASPHL